MRRIVPSIHVALALGKHLTISFRCLMSRLKRAKDLGLSGSGLRLRAFVVLGGEGKYEESDPVEHRRIWSPLGKCWSGSDQCCAE